MSTHRKGTPPKKGAPRGRANGTRSSNQIKTNAKNTAKQARRRKRRKPSWLVDDRAAEIVRISNGMHLWLGRAVRCGCVSEAFADSVIKSAGLVKRGRK